MGDNKIYGLVGLIGATLLGVAVVSSLMYREPKHSVPEVYVRGEPYDTKVIPSSLGGMFLTDVKTDDGYVIGKSKGSSGDLNAAKALIESESFDGDEDYVEFWGYECPGYMNINSIAADGKIVILEEKDICW